MKSRPIFVAAEYQEVHDIFECFLVFLSSDPTCAGINQSKRLIMDNYLVRDVYKSTLYPYII